MTCTVCGLPLLRTEHVLHRIPSEAYKGPWVLTNTPYCIPCFIQLQTYDKLKKAKVTK